MKRLCAIQIVVASLLATQAWSGNLTVNGNLTVTQSITLGEENRTNWPTGFRPGVVLTNGVLDTSLSQYYEITLNNDVTWDFQGHEMGRVFWLKVAQDATGGWTNSWDAEIVWPGGEPPPATTIATHWDLFQFIDDGAHWLAASRELNYGTNHVYALAFDGSQNLVRIAQSSAFLPTNFTIECWFKPGQRIADHYWNGIVASWPSSFVLYGDNNETIWFLLKTGGGTTGVSSGGTLSVDTWVHLAVTYDGSHLRLWINGTLDGTATCTGSPLSTGDLTIGGHDDGSFCPGTVDEVRISRVVRYTGTFQPPNSFTVDSDTVGYWEFNEGNGTAAADETGNHNGTLTGNPPPSWVTGR